MIFFMKYLIVFLLLKVGWPGGAVTPTVFLHEIMHEIMHKINQNDVFIFNILHFILNLCIYF